MCLITIVLKCSVLIQPLLKFQKPQTLTSSLNPTITVCFTHQLEDLQFLLIWGNSNVFFFLLCCFILWEHNTNISVTPNYKTPPSFESDSSFSRLFSTESAWLQSLFFLLFYDEAKFERFLFWNTVCNGNKFQSGTFYFSKDLRILRIKDGWLALANPPC